MPDAYLQNAVLNSVPQKKSSAPALTRTKQMCTRLQAVSACLRHCQEMMRRSIVIMWFN